MGRDHNLVVVDIVWVDACDVECDRRSIRTVGDHPLTIGLVAHSSVVKAKTTIMVMLTMVVMVVMVMMMEKKEGRLSLTPADGFVVLVWLWLLQIINHLRSDVSFGL